MILDNMETKRWPRHSLIDFKEEEEKGISNHMLLDYE